MLETAPPSEARRARVPPHSIEAEQSVLGAVFLDNRAWDKVSDCLGSDDFYRREHRSIFMAIAQLAQSRQPFDVLTVTEQLKSNGELDAIGGDMVLYELAERTPSAANVLSYATIVREKSVLRQLIRAGTDIADKALSGEETNVRTLLDQAEKDVFAIADQQTRGSGPVRVAELLSGTAEKIDFLQQTKGAITGLSTGYADFDAQSNGLQRGDMIIIAGRPSMGKTMLGMNIAENAALKAEKPVLVFSLEMPAEQITMRMIASLGRIDQTKLRSGQLNDDDWSRISSTISLLSQAKMYIDDTPALTPSEMRARARRVARENGGLSLIMVDYLQLMTVAGHRENRTNEVAEISRSLKAIAKELDVPLIALSQLSRSLESRTDRRPVMSDLRESGSIEQDADLILFIYRDEVYNSDSPAKGIAEIIMRKNRNGPIGDFRLTFQGKFTRFDSFMPNQMTSTSPFGD